MRYLERAAKALNWRTLADMDGERLNAWIASEQFGARMANHFIIVAKAFSTWCVKRGYLSKSPFTNLERRNERLDRRHIRRPLTPEEVSRLLVAAQERPKMEATRNGRTVSTEELDRVQWKGRTLSSKRATRRPGVAALLAA